MRYSRTIVLLLAVAACANPSVPDERIELQQAKVDSAAAAVERERAVLSALVDSFSARVAQNVALPMTEEQARETETARIKAQDEVVQNALRNLVAQKEYLVLLKQAARAE